MVQPDSNDSGKPEPPAKKSDGAGRQDQDLWRYLSAGTQLAVTVGLFVGLGWWLDQHFGWTPWGLVVAGMLGIGVGMYGFLKDALH